METDMEFRKKEPKKLYEIRKSLIPAWFHGEALEIFGVRREKVRQR